MTVPTTATTKRTARAVICCQLTPSFPALHHFARDDQALDFAGAFVQAENADIAVEALDTVIGDVA